MEGLPTFTLRIVLILLWLIVMNTILGYVLYNQAIIHLTAIQANVILNLSPFFTAILAWFLLGEKISLMQTAAMAIVFLGTYLVQRKPIQVQGRTGGESGEIITGQD